MIYRAIGIMSGSSLDGLDIAYVEFLENGSNWAFEIQQAECIPYDQIWIHRLQEATGLNALDYQLLHAEYGHYIGEQVNLFITKHQLQFKVALVASHGHTTFHIPARKMTAQLGDGAAIAAVTQLPVVSDLRAMDIAFGGQGAPIVPIGEQLLLKGYDYFLNLGGIANISINATPYQAFDICPANRVLNLLAADAGREFDDEGALARSGQVHQELLSILNEQPYYQTVPPKSLANEFGTEQLYPLIRQFGLSTEDALATCCEHIAVQLARAVGWRTSAASPQAKMLVTGGGAFNNFLMERIAEHLLPLQITVEVPDRQLVAYKEALIMALIGVLRWRESYNTLSSVTGALRNSVGGALWMGQEE
ncbi:anhydro-N-acetylmuramic acid kinase [Niabella terrae]